MPGEPVACKRAIRMQLEGVLVVQMVARLVNKVDRAVSLAVVRVGTVPARPEVA